MIMKKGNSEEEDENVNSAVEETAEQNDKEDSTLPAAGAVSQTEPPQEDDNDELSLEKKMKVLVTAHDQAWLMLATRVGLGISRPKAIEITTQTAVELFLANNNKKKEEQQQPQVTTSENEDDMIDKFRDKYLLDPTGSEELFHRSMFALADEEKTGVIGKEALLYFLDHSYSVGSAMRGGRALPPRQVLQDALLDTLQYKEPTKGGLSFEDIRTCVFGEIAKIDNVAALEEKSFEQQTAKERSHRENNSSERLQHILPEVQENEDDSKECDFCSWLDSLFSGGGKNNNNKKNNDNPFCSWNGFFGSK